ncbi:otoancorin-like [Limulus polyphemus]|uniref:Otoancorin-like n=1 Tax=Limulus polyphemus TaxID=6850 RepID=A0ABM1BBB8_LIMPO|nr:otoancorin-like [Limulus polyphemus]
MSGYGDELCFDLEMSDSIRKQLQKVHGMTTTGVRCLGCFLMTMNEQELSQIPDNVLADLSKDLSSCWNDMMKMSESTKMGLCMAEITEDERNTLMNQKKRLWKRVNQAKQKVAEDFLKEQTSDYRSKRETSRLTCSVIEATGSVAGFSVAELQTLSENEVQMCLYLLGKDELEEKQIEVLWPKVKMAYGSVSNLTEDEILLLGYLTKGFSETDINELPLTASSIEEFGKYWDLSESQLKCLANKTKQTLGRYLSNYVSTQLASLGHILCGMSQEDINSINDSVFRESINALGQLQECPSEVMQTLANKATKTTVYGSPNEWSSAIVYSLGGLIAGLSADELKKIPAESMKGVTPQAVSVLEPGVMKVLTTPQLNHLSYDSLAAITSDQLKQLSPEQQEAIYSARYRSSDQQDNGHNELAGTLPLVICAVLVVYYKTNIA